jgi:hypothetical protein
MLKRIKKKKKEEGISSPWYFSGIELGLENFSHSHIIHKFMVLAYKL